MKISTDEDGPKGTGQIYCVGVLYPPQGESWFGAPTPPSVGTPAFPASQTCTRQDHDNEQKEKAQNLDSQKVKRLELKKGEGREHNCSLVSLAQRDMRDREPPEGRAEAGEGSQGHTRSPHREPHVCTEALRGTEPQSPRTTVHMGTR